MAGPEQGLNTAIASGAAFGNGGAHGPGAFSGAMQSLFGGGLNAAAGFLSEKKWAQGFSLENVKGFLLKYFDGALRENSFLKGFFDMFESKEDMFKNTLSSHGKDGALAGSGGNVSSGSDGTATASSGSSGSTNANSSSSTPFTAVEGTAIPGLTGGEPVPRKSMGFFSPTPTPTVGGHGQGMGWGVGAPAA